MIGSPIRAVFFDVDFTLIYPGPTFQGEGYERFCSSYGMSVDASRFQDAVVAASTILDEQPDHVYDAEVFIRYARRIIEGMGGNGPGVDACARQIYLEWAACQHFELYDDVAPVLKELASRGLKIGLISNSHRCLASFQEHFDLRGLITSVLSSSEHGFLKPHPSIFEASLRLADVTAGESVMVGDSLSHDIEGARRVGMRGILVRRGVEPGPLADTEISVVRSLFELLSLL